MPNQLTGYVSCICSAKNIAELEAITSFASNFLQLHSDFEIIVCMPSGKIDAVSIKNFCEKSPNVAVYEVTSTNFDDLITAALELALGDWVLELADSSALENHASMLLNCAYNDLQSEIDSYQLTPIKLPIVDRILSNLASSALEVRVHTLAYTSRLTKRAAMQTWNARKLRSKVLRVAPQLSGANVLERKIINASKLNYSRIGRVGMRTIAHSSAKPLRWISFISLSGALLSLVISAAVVAISANNKVVPGWTTTNLQISGLSFLTLSVLGILSEYIYQIAAVTIGQPVFRIVRETLSPRYAFQVKPNIYKSRED